MMEEEGIWGETRIRVRYADTDQMGVAYNGVYFTWFEVGRTELLRRTHLTYRDVEEMGVHLPVVEGGVKFLKPARYDDVITVRTAIAHQKGIRVRFVYELWRDDEKLAVGYTEHVFTDKDLHPTRPPEVLRDLAGRLKEHSAGSHGEGLY